MNGRVLATVTTAVFMLSAGCKDAPTQVRDPGFPGHLEGQVFGAVGRPFGFGIAADGRGLLMQLDGHHAARFGVEVDSVIPEFAALDYNPIDVSFSPDGDLAYASILDGNRIFVVNMASGAVVDTFAFGAHHHRILVSPAGDRFWVTTIDGKVYAVDAASGALLDSAVIGGVVRGIARGEDGTLVVSNGGMVTLLDGNTLDRKKVRGIGGTAQEVVYSADGASIFVAFEGNGSVLRFNATNLMPEGSIALPAGTYPFAMAMSPDGTMLLVSSAMSGRVEVVDVARGRRVRSLDTGGIPRRIAFSPDGTRAFISNEGGWIDIVGRD